MFAAALAVLATAASVLGAGCPAGQVGVGEILVCPGLQPSCNGTDTSLAIYAPGSCSPIGYSQLIGESRLCGGAISDGFTTGCHQNNVSIELDYVTVPDGTTYSKCTSLKEPITCGKYVPGTHDSYIIHCCSK